ncbi:MAG: hypothetical protein AAB604_00025 [Patescibacteria group bacterium]|mgnify:CR=1 FL=1|jgi:ribosomal protein S6
MDKINTEERRLYELSYMLSTNNENAEELALTEHRVREAIEHEGGVIQDTQPPKKERNSYRGLVHFITAPSALARIERAARGVSSLERVLAVQWERTVKSRRHAFMRQQPAAKETPSQMNDQIDKKLDELLQIP